MAPTTYQVLAAVLMQAAVLYCARVGWAANCFSTGVIDILDYTSLNKNKTIRNLTGREDNSAGIVIFSSGLWLNSSTAISSLTLIDNGGANFAQYSSFALYGVKG